MVRLVCLFIYSLTIDLLTEGMWVGSGHRYKDWAYGIIEMDLGLKS